ncbi:AMP-binding protein [Virgibacillus sp. 179-BFC.A HS]|uniref:AMP-binding protein n=1 Tax=Tigheibacillus jepli TaxID=3035914 RepID=A0ABU5CD85_9BACI|nr:AMP-binding protein [Virgibacillus sp. 179-BFC.A HS]MDY0404301.1 AMP-binding protein [Virgibacillus sp. 179-BFC.A HS]
MRGVCGLPEFNGSTVQYKTIDRDTGADLPAGAIGELAVRGNTVTRGYYKKPEETAKTIDKDVWLRTGMLAVSMKMAISKCLAEAKICTKFPANLLRHARWKR